MSSNKTKPTAISIPLFINEIVPEQKQKDSRKLYTLMERVIGAHGVLWGTSINGFGDYHYKYESGREGDWFLIGFSPRKKALTVYLMCDISMKKILLKDLVSSQKERDVFI